MDIGKLTFDSFIETGVLTGVISEVDLRKVQLLAGQTIINERQPTEFQILVASGHPETPSVTVEKQFEVGDIQIEERSRIMTNLTSPLFGTLFLQRNCTLFRHGSKST